MSSSKNCQFMFIFLALCYAGAALGENRSLYLTLSLFLCTLTVCSLLDEGVSGKGMHMVGSVLLESWVP